MNIFPKNSIIPLTIAAQFVSGRHQSNITKPKKMTTPRVQKNNRLPERKAKKFFMIRKGLFLLKIIKLFKSMNPGPDKASENQ